MIRPESRQAVSPSPLSGGRGEGNGGDPARSPTPSSLGGARGEGKGDDPARSPTPSSLTGGKGAGKGGGSLTPLERQYRGLKARYPDVILFFQLGDFYETFERDAEIVARVCEIALTSREFGKGNRVPLAGVPVTRGEHYVGRMLQAGHIVALCQQLTPPGKGLVERDVVRLITPGTVIEPSLLRPRENNYLAAVALGPDGVGLAYADVTTGEFCACEQRGPDAGEVLAAELHRLQPAELLAPASQRERVPPCGHVQWLDDRQFHEESGREGLCRQLGVRSLDGYGCRGKPLAVAAAGAILDYLARTDRKLLGLLVGLRVYSPGSYMGLDAATRRNLELVRGARSGTTRGSLLAVLDLTKTPMGGRLLRRMVSQPLLDLDEINRRLDAVQALVDRPALRARLLTLLGPIGDLERLTSRAEQGVITVRELLALRELLRRLPKLQEAIEEMESNPHPLSPDPCTEVVDLIARAIAEGGRDRIIRPGFSVELDEVVASIKEAQRWVARLEQAERERTGVRGIKVGFNNVSGYYLELSKTALASRVGEAAREQHQRQVRERPDLAALPDPVSVQDYLERFCGYLRKQTLTNSERYITLDLKDRELFILTGEERIAAIEARLLDEVRRTVAGFAGRLLRTATAIAWIDVFAALAEVASQRGYVRPALDDGPAIDIVGGRHPVVEASLPPGEFIANDCRLANDGPQIMLLTGPNMAGKSTYLRQVALIVLMAQIGSFVPAKSASIGLADRIFTRVGAQDDLAAGQSTFMLEMVETAAILHGATARSLVLLDEVGRGTSTYDGISIARAVVEHLHDAPDLGCKTLFATHYHELTALDGELARVRNYQVQVLEEPGGIAFLYRVVPGGADRSYGIQVARLAGLPLSAIRRAEEVLRSLEARPTISGEKQVSVSFPGIPLQLSLFGDDDPAALADLLPKLRWLLDQVKAVDLATTTPLEALSILAEWQRRVRNGRR